MQKQFLYIPVSLAAVAALLCLLAVYIDSFDVYAQHHQHHEDGVVKKHAMVIRQFNLIKPYKVLEDEYGGLILGPSVAGRLPTQHDYWQGVNAYNASWIMMNVQESLAFLQHAHHHAPIKKVIMTLDLGVFTPGIRNHFSERRYKTNSGFLEEAGFVLQRQLDLLYLAFRRDTRKYLMGDYREPGALVYDDGQWEKDPERHDLEKATWGRLARVSKNTALFTGTTYEPFDALVKFCYENDIEIDFIIPPVLPLFLSAWELSGNQSMKDEWKRSLVKVLDDNAKAYNKPAFRLRDFQAFDDVYMHEINNRLVTEQAFFFWDALHFNQAMGKEILNVLKHGDSRFVWADLTVENIEQQIEKQNKARQVFKQKYADMHERFSEGETP